MSTLIIIRGNSGSGKSTIAKLLRDQIPKKTALIEQDYLRRTVLNETGKSGDDNVSLIEQVAEFALQKEYVTILEGILPKQRYGKMLHKLTTAADKVIVCYMDIPFDVTLQRHALKPEAADFGETEMRSWYTPSDFLNTEHELIIGEETSAQSVVDQILIKLE